MDKQMEKPSQIKMRLQVLVSTMNQQNCQSLIEKMNIRTDSIVINQCDCNKFEDFTFRGRAHRFLSLKETGVGLSRNTALMRSDADIVLFADDDVRYDDDYEKKILNAFDDPKVDVCLFNMRCVTPGKSNRINFKKKRVHFFRALHYGAVRIAVRLRSIQHANIFFSLLFGGGALYSSGEDSLFIWECLKKGLRIYTSPDFIGEVSHSQSTWFKGYTDKFFFDKGVLFSHISKRWANILCLQFALRHRKMFKKEKSWLDAYKIMLQGVKNWAKTTKQHTPL